MNYRIYLICLDKTNELWMELYYSLGNTIPNNCDSSLFTELEQTLINSKFYGNVNV